MKLKNSIKKVLTAFAVALFWITVWYMAAEIVAKPVLLPTPKETIITIFTLMKTKTFYLSCLLTVVRVFTGFIAGIIIGTLVGVATYKSKALSVFLAPLNAIIKATPVASFIILLLVWMKKGTIPSFTSFLIVTPIIWSAVNSSLKTVDVKLREAACIFSLSPIKRIKYLYIPEIKPEYAAAVNTTLGLAWKSGVAAEVLCTPKYSIGRELYNSKVYLETDYLFAWTLCVILLSVLVELLIGKAVKRLTEK